MSPVDRAGSVTGVNFFFFLYFNELFVLKCFTFFLHSNL